MFSTTIAFVDAPGKKASFLVQLDGPLSEPILFTYLIPPWRCHNWTYTISYAELLHLHPIQKYAGSIHYQSTSKQSRRRTSFAGTEKAP